jgi:hypothetical protein
MVMLQHAVMGQQCCCAQEDLAEDCSGMGGPFNVEIQNLNFAFGRGQFFYSTLYAFSNNVSLVADIDASGISLAQFVTGINSTHAATQCVSQTGSQILLRIACGKTDSSGMGPGALAPVLHPSNGTEPNTVYWMYQINIGRTADSSAPYVVFGYFEKRKASEDIPPPGAKPISIITNNPSMWPSGCEADPQSPAFSNYVGGSADCTGVSDESVDGIPFPTGCNGTAVSGAASIGNIVIS